MLALGGCGAEPPPRLPTRVTPLVARHDDGGVVLQTSAFVELHVWLVFLATHHDTHVPPPLSESVASYTKAFEGERTDALARATTERLSGCADLACAREGLAAAGLGEAFGRAFSWFERQVWPQAQSHADAAIVRLRAALPETFPALVEALGRELAISGKIEARLDVVHESPLYEDDPEAPLALEDSAPCLRGRREDDPEALACALYQVALATRERSAVFRAIERRDDQEKDDRARTMHLYALVAAHAVRVVARAGSGTAKESFTAQLLAREPEAEGLFARGWKARTTGDFVRSLDRAVRR